MGKKIVQRIRECLLENIKRQTTGYCQCPDTSVIIQMTNLVKEKISLTLIISIFPFVLHFSRHTRNIYPWKLKQLKNP